MKHITLRLIKDIGFKHSIEVSNRLRRIALNKYLENQEIVELYYNLGLIHSVGKSSMISNYNFSPLDSYLFLKKETQSMNILIPILLQSWSEELVEFKEQSVKSKFENITKGLSISNFQRELIDDLNYVNWTTSGSGEIISPEIKLRKKIENEKLSEAEVLFLDKKAKEIKAKSLKY